VSEHGQGLLVINILELLNEVAQFHLSIGEDNTIDSSNSVSDQIVILLTPSLAAAARTSSRRWAETLPRHTNLNASGLPVAALTAATMSFSAFAWVRLSRLTH
jgi:uncharacterized lipoprotein